jgi:RNA polymerase sigma factor (sigma-70 family)
MVTKPNRPTGGQDARELAVERLFDELRPLVVRTVRLVVGAGSTVAEDAAQEALLELRLSLPRLREHQAAPAFAVKIATRVAVRTARRERRRALIPFHRREYLHEANRPQELLELKEAFDRLTPRLRATAVLRLYVGLSEAETADALDCSIGTVKSQLHEARRRLRRQLNDRPVADSTPLSTDPERGASV